MEEVGVGQVVHDEVAGLVLELEEDGLVLADVFVLKSFDLDEVLFEVKYVLGVKIDGFGCV